MEIALSLISKVVKREDGYHIMGEGGKHLGGPYSKESADKRLKEIEMFKHMKKAVVGLCGFSNPALSCLYASRKHGVSQLSTYAETFGSVEIQSTHHKFPTTDLMRKWASATPADFVFSLRAPKTIKPGSRQAATLMSMFLRRVAILGKKLGPVVVTIPRGQGYESGDADAFFSSLPPHQYAVLIESSDWDNGEVYSSAVSHNMAIVEGGPIGMKSADWRYLRIDSKLLTQDMADRIASQSTGKGSVFAFIDTKFPVAMSQTELDRILRLLNLDKPLTNLAPAIPSISDPITGPNNRSTPVGANDDRRDYPGVDPIESVDGDKEPRQNTYPDTEGYGLGKVENKKDGEGGTDTVLKEQI